MIKVGIIEDDPITLEEITDIVNMSADLECVMAASSAEQFLKYFTADTDIDIILFDINLPGISGIDAIIAIKNKKPDIQAIVLSIHHDNDTIFRALRAGATGYLIKDTAHDRLAKLLIDVQNGIPALSPAIASRVIRYFYATPIENKSFQLSPKETEVLKLLIEGLSYKIVADKLKISINTLRFHVKKIYKKLHVNSQPELMKLYIDGKIRLSN